MRGNPLVSEQTPLDILQRFSRGHKDQWRRIDELRETRDPDHADWPWPAHIFLPQAYSMRLVQPASGTDNLAEWAHETTMLCGLAGWRTTMGIYRFDPDLYEALIKTPIGGTLPVDLLLRLPEWTTCIEIPGMESPFGGTIRYVLAWHNLISPETDGRVDDPVLQLLFVDGRHDDEVLTIPLRSTLEDSIIGYVSRWVDNAALGLVEPVDSDFRGKAEALLAPILSLLLYLCADQAEYARPTPPAPKKTKRGWRLFPADAPRTWDVGIRLGQALRRASAAADVDERNDPGDSAVGERHRPRAHVRRGHWHTVLSGKGSKKDPRKAKRVLRWFPPIPVNVDDLDELPAVVKPVSDSS